MKINLTFDDVQIVPRYSELKSRQDVDLDTKFTKNTTLHRTPIVAAPMDTICEYEMANEMLDQGGVGVIHRFRSIEKQAKDMKRLWTQWDSWYNIGGADKDRTDHDRIYQEWYKKIRQITNCQLTIIGHTPEPHIHNKLKTISSQNSDIIYLGSSSPIPHFLIAQEISSADFGLV